MKVVYIPADASIQIQVTHAKHTDPSDFAMTEPYANATRE